MTADAFSDRLVASSQLAGLKLVPSEVEEEV
jgi:hypothetical protein